MHIRAYMNTCARCMRVPVAGHACAYVVEIVMFRRDVVYLGSRPFSASRRCRIGPAPLPSFCSKSCLSVKFTVCNANADLMIQTGDFGFFGEPGRLASPTRALGRVRGGPASNRSTTAPSAISPNTHRSTFHPRPAARAPARARVTYSRSSAWRTSSRCSPTSYSSLSGAYGPACVRPGQHASAHNARKSPPRVSPRATRARR
jgi:hypothetical protein